MRPHKHAELIKAWADGAEIQYFDYEEGWTNQEHPAWYVDTEYRIKPDPKQDIVAYTSVARWSVASNPISYSTWQNYSTELPNDEANLMLVWDSETGKLKEAEVLP